MSANIQLGEFYLEETPTGAIFRIAMRKKKAFEDEKSPCRRIKKFRQIFLFPSRQQRVSHSNMRRRFYERRDKRLILLLFSIIIFTERT